MIKYLFLFLCAVSFMHAQDYNDIYNDIMNELPKDALFIQHEPKRTREKPYACSSCLATFASRSSLVRHTRIHTGEKPYVCHICFKADSDHSNHKRHMEQHMGIYYPCLICHTSHSGKSNFRRHQNSKWHKKKAMAVQDVLSEPSSIIDPGTEVWD